MPKEYLKDITVTTIILLYLYVCGGLYLIGYWSTFKVDVSNFIGLADIPKNFIFPFLIANGAFLLFALLYTAALTLSGTTMAELKKKLESYKVWRWIMGLSGYYLVAMFVYIVYEVYEGSQYSFFYWISVIVIIGGTLLVKFLSSKILVSRFPSFLTRYLISALAVGFPVISFATGKLRSLQVYHNNDIKYIRIIKINNAVTKLDSASLKLLGFLGDKLIVSSLDNKKILFLNQGSYEGIQLEEGEKKEAK